MHDMGTLFCGVSSLFTNSNWFTFPDERIDNAATLGSSSMMEEINLNDTANGGNNSSDDEVVVGEDDDLTGTKDLSNNASTSNPGSVDGIFANGVDLDMSAGKSSVPSNSNFFRFEIPENEDLFADGPLPEWVGWSESADMQVGGSSVNPFDDIDESDINMSSSPEVAADASCPPQEVPMLPNGRGYEDSSGSSGSDTSTHKGVAMPSLFEENVEFVGVELEGTEKAMEQALKEGIVGEAGPLKRKILPEKENSNGVEEGMKEFNDANYWRVEQEVAILD